MSRVLKNCDGTLRSMLRWKRPVKRQHRRCTKRSTSVSSRPSSFQSTLYISIHLCYLPLIFMIFPSATRQHPDSCSTVRFPSNIKVSFHPSKESRSSLARFQSTKESWLLSSPFQDSRVPFCHESNHQGLRFLVSKLWFTTLLTSASSRALLSSFQAIGALGGLSRAPAMVLSSRTPASRPYQTAHSRILAENVFLLWEELSATSNGGVWSRLHHGPMGGALSAIHSVGPHRRKVSGVDVFVRS